MAFVVPPGSIVAGTPSVPGNAGSYCPTSWDEDFDRAQMSTQVLIGHGTPSNVPVLRYDFPGSFADPPAAGAITMDNTQQTATVMRVAKTDQGGTDQSVWLRYITPDATVTITSAARATPDDNNKRRGYRVVGAPVEHASYFAWPIFWSEGTDAIDPGPVDLTLGVVAETPQLWQDDFGVDHYGRLTFNRTDLIRVDPLTDPVYKTLADRILEVRGSNSVPRLEAVTIDARTGPDWYPIHNMNLMSSAAPEKPSRYMCCLKVDGRTIFSRMCFASGIRHFIARDEWTTRITLDLAEWAGTL